MLENLVATIEVLSGRIKEHRQYFARGEAEARTRTALIDPLLGALEWDVGDPNFVEIEPDVGRGRVDYALLGRTREPIVLLEAKKLIDTQVPYEQLAGYVVSQNLRRSSKIPYCAATNGSRWVVMDVHNQETVLDVAIERDEPRRSALRLLALWQPVLRDSHTVEPVRSMERGGLSAAGTGDRGSDGKKDESRGRASSRPDDTDGKGGRRRRIDAVTKGAIEDDLRAGTLSHAKIAKKHGVSRGAVWNVRKSLDGAGG